MSQEIPPIRKQDIIVADQIPYFGVPACRDCPYRKSKIVERKLHNKTITELICEHIALCATVRAITLDRARALLLHGDGDPAPRGLLSELERQGKKEPEA